MTSPLLYWPPLLQPRLPEKRVLLGSKSATSWLDNQSCSGAATVCVQYWHTLSRSFKSRSLPTPTSTKDETKERAIMMGGGGGFHYGSHGGSYGGSNTASDRESASSSSSPISPSDRVHLLIGLNYSSEGPESQLYGCIHDVTVTAPDVLKRFAPATDKIVLTDQNNPTTSSILAAIHQVAGMDKRVTIFWYSGHGVRQGSTDEGIVPPDFRRGGSIILDDTLNELFYTRTRHTNKKIFCVFDCCHSGSMLDLQHHWSVRPDGRDPRHHANGSPAYRSLSGTATTATTTTATTATTATTPAPAASEPYIVIKDPPIRSSSNTHHSSRALPSGQVVIALGACLESQVDADQIMPSRPGGALSTAKQEAWRRHGLGMTWRQLLMTVQKVFAENHIRQFPTLECNVELNLDSAIQL